MKMSMRKQVDTRIVAVAIILVLALVQWVWWKGLVSKPNLGPSRPPSMGGQQGITEPLITGRHDLVVATIAGAPDPGDTDGNGRMARFDGPCGLALDGSANVIVADSRNHRIRIISPTGKTETIAGSDSGFVDGPAGQAKFNTPCGVAVAKDGTIYVADTGNQRIRAIRAGQVTTVAGSGLGFADGVGSAAKFNLPVGVAVSSDFSTVLIADGLNKRLRAINPAGQVSSLQSLPAAVTAVADIGGPAATVPETGLIVGKAAVTNVGIPGSPVKLKFPLAICAAPEGWYASDSFHCALFQIRNGAAEVLAGTCISIRPNHGYRDGLADQALFGQISGITTNGKGLIYVSDISNNCIRRITQAVADSQSSPR
jgi:sugar lactone lactonase YvrE